MIQLEQPHKLSNFIKDIWFIDEHADYYNHNSITPDSSIELIINCGAPLELCFSNGSTLPLPSVFIKGLQDAPIELAVAGKQACIIGVSLQAWSISAMSDKSQLNRSFSIIPLGELWQDYARAVIRTANQKGLSNAGLLAGQIITDTLLDHQDFEVIREVVHTLSVEHGQIPIQKLASDSHLSLSQLERRFKGATGVTLKHFARLTRFETARNSLHSKQKIKLTNLAYDLGYTDQAHFIRDFRKFAHMTPGEYLKHLNNKPT